VEVATLPQQLQPESIADEVLALPQLLKAPPVNTKQLVADTLAACRAQGMEPHDLLLGAKPGDAIEYLMGRSYDLVRQRQRQYYPEMIAAVLGPDALLGRAALTDALGARLEQIRDMFKRMSQSVFSVAGTCFQEYVALWLELRSIPFEAQKSVDGERRPDFVLPSAAFYMAPQARGIDDAVLLSLKRTARERWRQSLGEGRYVQTRYLLTLDKAVTASTIRQMRSENFLLIVTEKDRQAMEQYKDADTVWTYRTLMDDLLEPKRRDLWAHLPSARSGELFRG
jgi:hypothetical protein